MNPVYGANGFRAQHAVYRQFHAKFSGKTLQNLDRIGPGVHLHIVDRGLQWRGQLVDLGPLKILALKDRNRLRLEL